MYSLITLPDPDVIITSSSSWTTAFLPEFWILVGAGIGILVVGLVVVWLMRNLRGGVARAFGSRRGGRRRRR